jgi:hypothetical protein
MKTDFIVSSHRPNDAAPEGYVAFDIGVANKFVIDPHGSVSRRQLPRAQRILALDECGSAPNESTPVEPEPGCKQTVYGVRVKRYPEHQYLLYPRFLHGEINNKFSITLGGGITGTPLGTQSAARSNRSSPSLPISF